ncbi:MAG: hypothetical protein HUK26_07140, partial [Duodenibacillus sp.]|nr:hypothetical protein [Duodenibacillus sp.]
STGVRHNFGPAIGYAGAQYFKDARDFTVGEYQGTKWLTDASTNGNKKGFGAYLGVDIPAAGGFIKANVGYMKAKGSEDTSKKLTRWTASAGYWYNLSKRSVLWGGVGYTRDDLDGVKTASGKSYGAADAISAGCGIVHNF